MKRKINLIITIYFFVIVMIPIFVYAEQITFQRDYTYQASELDSKVSSRTIAFEQIKKILLEEIGTYIESRTEITDFQLTKDQVVALTGGIVKTEIYEEKWDGQKYYMKARVSVDPDSVVKSIDTLRKDDERKRELEESQKKAQEALQEIERLKTELASSKTSKTEKVDKYNEAVQDLTVGDIIQSGVKQYKKREYEKAIASFSKAIKLNKKNAWAFYHRGMTYKKLSRYYKAIYDYSSAVEIDPSLSWAYYNRGIAYDKVGMKVEAKADYLRAAKRGDRFAQRYLDSRGIQWDKKNVNDKEASQPTKYTGAYVASKWSKYFHRTDCEWADKIKPSNRIFYKSKKEAINDNKIPCTTCKP